MFFKSQASFLYFKKRALKKLKIIDYKILLNHKKINLSSIKILSTDLTNYQIGAE